MGSCLLFIVVVSLKSNLFLKDIYFSILRVCLFCLYICLYTTCLSGGHRGQKSVSYLLKLELQIVASCQVDPGNWIQDLCKSSRPLSHHLSRPPIINCEVNEGEAGKKDKKTPLWRSLAHLSCKASNFSISGETSKSHSTSDATTKHTHDSWV